MKLFEFKPKLVSCLKNYSKETFMADLMAGIIVGIVALPLAIAFGIASGVSPEKVLSRYHCGIHHFPVGRQQSPDRRSYGSIYRHYLWHHTTIRRGRTDCSHANGGRTPCIIRSVQAGSCHQIHSLSYHRRIYQRYRRHYFHDPDCRYFRFIFRRRESAGRLRREVADLFPTLRHDQLVEYHR